MEKKISTTFTQQYSKKVSLLSQQTGKYGKGKVRFKQTKARKSKTSSMNKNKRRSWKAYNSQGH
jgi:hypothetical protein